MWSLFHHLLPLAAGFVGDFQQALNTSRGEMTLLTSDQLTEFIPYTEFARAAYCAPNRIAEWQCGGKFSPYHFKCLNRFTDPTEGACRALPSFVPTLTGGDGDGTQFCEHRFNPRRLICFPELINIHSLCGILALPVRGRGGSSRHRPTASVCLSFLPLNQLPNP